MEDFESILSSEVFNVTGPQGRNFQVHCGVLEQKSKVLAAEINSPMKEAEEKNIHIQDLDGDFDDATVLRFIQYAYTGDYTVPAPDIVLTTEDIDLRATDNDEVVDPLSCDDVAKEEDYEIPDDPESQNVDLTPPSEDNWTTFMSSSKKNKKKKGLSGWTGVIVSTRNKRDAWSQFRNAATLSEVPAWEPVSSKDSCSDYTPVLLCHAKLYIFSSRYECRDLRKLVLQRLRLTLSRLADKLIGKDSVVTLAKHVYDHTQDYSGFGVGVRDKLRKIVLEFLACNIGAMVGNSNFEELLGNDSSLARDLVMMMAKWVV